MNLMHSLNTMLDYIEDNLENDIEISSLANMMFMSEHYFKTMFSCLADVSINEYIRNRRLSLAAEKLKNGYRVIDTALICGYSSPDSFAKAFTKFHGVKPSSVKNGNTIIKTYSRISFQITKKGDKKMNCKIIEKEPFKMYGIEKIISEQNDEMNSKEIPDFWTEIVNDGMCEKLMQSTNQLLPKNGIGLVNAVMCYEPYENKSFPYMIGCFSTVLSDSTGYKEISIDRYTWAIFRTEDHQRKDCTAKIQELWRNIFSEWLPSSSYKLIDGPNLELYGTNNGLSYSEVWLPVSH